MDFKVVKELNKCRILWNKFSKNESLWDLWDIVNCFYDPKLYEPYFIVSKNPTGLLPLWFDKKQRIYSFFGGEYPEDHHFWFDVSKFFDFIKNIKGKIGLYEINQESFQKLDEDIKKKFEQNVKDYFLNLKDIDNNLYNHLKKFSKKHRKNLKYDLKNLEKLNYKIIHEKNEHFEDFIRLSLARFGKESDLSDKNFARQMNKFIDYLKAKDMLHTICIEINKKIEAIEFAALYNGIYYILNGASNMKFENLGKLIIISHIKNAIVLKADKIDFLAGESKSWKELWNLQYETYYDYIR